MHFNIPFVLFTLNLLALNAHGQHAGDVILAVNDAATITTSTIAATAPLLRSRGRSAPS